MTDINEFVEQILRYKATIVACWLVLLFLSERAFPKAKINIPPKDVWRRVGRNISSFAILGLLSRFIVIPVTIFAASHALDWRPNWWGGWQGLLLDLLILDLFIYWWHRFNHIFPLLWRFHVVHHLDEFLDTTTAVRFHFGEVLLSALVRGCFVFLCGIPFESILIFEGLVLVSSIFQHSNIYLPDWLDKAIAYVIVTPGWHWMHHHAERQDTDSNYANSLTIWDRLFGSKCQNKRNLSMPIGIEGQKEETFLQLQTRPFRRG